MAIIRGRYVHMASDKPAPPSSVPLEESLSTQQKSRLRSIAAIEAMGQQAQRERLDTSLGVLVTHIGQHVTLTAEGQRVLKRVRAGHGHGRR